MKKRSAKLPATDRPDAAADVDAFALEMRDVVRLEPDPRGRVRAVARSSRLLQLGNRARVCSCSLPEGSSHRWPSRCAIHLIRVRWRSTTRPTQPRPAGSPSPRSYSRRGLRFRISRLSEASFVPAGKRFLPALFPPRGYLACRRVQSLTVTCSASLRASSPPHRRSRHFPREVVVLPSFLCMCRKTFSACALPTARPPRSQYRSLAMTCSFAHARSSNDRTRTAVGLCSRSTT